VAHFDIFLQFFELQGFEKPQKKCFEISKKENGKKRKIPVFFGFFPEDKNPFFRFFLISPFLSSISVFPSRLHKFNETYSMVTILHF